MGKAVLLVSPELNPTDVTVTHSAAQGREIGVAVADAGNSEQLRVVTKGDAGDDDDHTFRAGGSQEIPTYRPDDQYTDPTGSFTRHVAESVTGIKQGAAVTADDRFHVVTLAKTATDTWELRLWRATTAGVSSIASKTLTFDETKWDLTSLGATSIRGKQAITVAIFVKDITNADARASRVRWFRISAGATSPAWGVLGTQKIVDMVPGLVQATDFVGMDGHLDIETDGSVWALAFQIRESNADIAGSSGGNESQVFICTGSAVLNLKLSAYFGGAASDWWWQPKLWHSPHWGFVLTATQAASDTTTRSMRVRHSKDGTNWQNEIGAPGTPARVLNGWGVAVAGENRRLSLIWNEGDGTDNTSLKFFNGDEEDDDAWSAIVLVDVGSQLDGDTFIAAANWRGEIWFVTRASSGGTATDNIEVIRGNKLTASDTGFERELVLGEPVYIDGPMDETETALFVVATGTVIDGDSWTIGVEYQFAGANVLREAPGEAWRSADNGTPDLAFERVTAGELFPVDTLLVERSNMPDLVFEMDDADTFDSDGGSPQVSATLSAVLATLTVASASGNRVVFTTEGLEANEHGRPGQWVELSTGIFRILENGADWVLVDGLVGSPTGTARVFGDQMDYFFESLNVRAFARLRVPSAIEVPDDYYEIGRVLYGVRLQFPRNISNGFRESFEPVADVIDLRGGGAVAAIRNERLRRLFTAEIQLGKEDTHIAPVRRYYQRALGGVRQVAFWPKGSDGPAILGRLTGTFDRRHVNQTWESVERIEIREDIA